jgi:hypothetical protein
MSIELENPLPLARHEETTILLCGRPFAQYLSDALQHGDVGLFEIFFLDLWV